MQSNETRTFTLSMRLSEARARKIKRACGWDKPNAQIASIAYLACAQARGLSSDMRTACVLVWFVLSYLCTGLRGIGVVYPRLCQRVPTNTVCLPRFPKTCIKATRSVAGGKSTGIRVRANQKESARLRVPLWARGLGRVEIWCSAPHIPHRKPRPARRK